MTPTRTMTVQPAAGTTPPPVSEPVRVLLLEDIHRSAHQLFEASS